jgi:predicted alpha/beta superfamily hydrolase
MTGDTSNDQQAHSDSPKGLTIQLSTVQAVDKPIFIAGNFNNWKTNDPAFQLQKTGSYTYRYHFPDKANLPDTLEYKYSLGSWDYVELNKYGEAVDNRVLKVAEREDIQDHVPLWLLNGKNYDDALRPIPHIISQEFEIPQLIKTRRISALIPHDYYKTDKRYPVLYLQDGQNLFDDYAPYGNWAVDKKMALMAARGIGDFIVIAIDHAKEDRIEEFTPSYNTRLGVGDGKKYIRFLADTLKPYIDKHFRTLPDRMNTGIGGSSMGALISIYAGLIYPEVYSKLLIFSPSLWVTPNMHFHYMNLYHNESMKVYLYGGEGESDTMVPSLRRFKQALEAKASAPVSFKISIDPHGKHNEERWGKEFPKAIEWLFFNAEEN